MRSSRKGVLGAALVVAAAALKAASAYAQSGSVVVEPSGTVVVANHEHGALIEQLSAQIAALEARVRALEALRGPVAATTETSASAATPSPAIAIERKAVVGDLGRFPDDAVVEVGTFDRALSIPGTDLSIRLGGLAQADAIYDTGAIATPDVFLARAIEADGMENAMRLSARSTRLNVDVRGDTAVGPFRSFLEGDFAGTGGTELVSNSYSFRLRHAFGQLGPVYAGQYWSAFVDVSAFPETVDPTSPASKSVTRQPSVRYVGRTSEGTKLAIAVENPETDTVLPPDLGLEVVERAPDLHAYARVQGGWGHLQLASAVRFFAVERASGGEARAIGWGLNLTGRVQLPFIGKDNLVFCAVGGDGIGRYLIELAGAGYDAALDPTSGELVTVTSYGGYLGFQHWWTETLRTTVAVGRVEVEVPDFLSGSSLSSATTASANLLWNPIPPVTLGVESLWGLRENRDGNDADAVRVHTVARYAF